MGVGWRILQPFAFQNRGSDWLTNINYLIFLDTDIRTG